MAETEEVIAEEGKTFNQVELDGILTKRLGKVETKHQEAMDSMKTQLDALTAEKASIEAAEVAATNAKMSTNDKLDAALLAIDGMKQDRLADKQALADAASAKVVGDINSSDEKALIEAGFDSAYTSMILPKLVELRGVENGAAFYKDGEGTLSDRASAISALAAKYPALITINRAGGNDVATKTATSKAPGQVETLEQMQARRTSEGYYDKKR